MKYEYPTIEKYQFGSVLELINDIQRYQRGTIWPFEAVKADHVLSTFKGMDEALAAANNRKLENRKVPLEAIFDKTAVTLQMLNIKAAMDKEIAYKIVNDPESNELGRMKDLAAAINRGLYTIDDRIAIQIEDQLDTQLNRGYNYADLKVTEYDAALDDCDQYAKRLVDKHVKAFAEAYRHIDNIIDVGLPPETKAGAFMNRLQDKLSGDPTYEQKCKCQDLVRNLIVAERDIEVLKNYIVPKLDVQIIEAAKWAKLEQDRNLEDGTNEHYFKDQLKELLEKKQSISQSLERMQHLEKLYQRNGKTIDVVKSADHQTWKIKAQRSNGGKIENSKTNPFKLFKLQLAAKIEVTRERDNKEQTRDIIIGNNTRETYSETHTQESTKSAASVEASVLGKEEKAGIGGDAGWKYMHHKRETEKETAMTGNRSRKYSNSFKVLEGNISAFIKTAKSKFKIFEGKGSVGEAKVIAEADGLKSKVKASAKVVGAEVNALNGALSYSFDFSSFSIGADLNKIIVSALDELKNNAFEYQSVEQVVDDMKQVVIDKVPSIGASVINGSHSIAGVGILEDKMDIPNFTMEHENKIQLWRDILDQKVPLDISNWSVQDVDDFRNWLEEQKEAKFQEIEEGKSTIDVQEFGEEVLEELEEEITR